MFWNRSPNLFGLQFLCILASQVALVAKNLPANAGNIRDTGSIPGWGRSPGGGHGNSLQYSCLQNPIDRGDWWATVHGVTESDTTERLSTEWSLLLIHRELFLGACPLYLPLSADLPGPDTLKSLSFLASPLSSRYYLY